MANLLVSRDVIIACGGTQYSFTALPSAHRWHANNYCERRTRHNITIPPHMFYRIEFVYSLLYNLYNFFFFTVLPTFLHYNSYFIVTSVTHQHQHPCNNYLFYVQPCVFYYFSFSCTDKLNINPFVFSILLFAVILIIIFSIYTYHFISYMYINAALVNRIFTIYNYNRRYS